LEIVITGLFTFLAVFIAYKLENDKLKQERKIIFIHLLKSFKHEIEGNLGQLDKAFENKNKSSQHIKETIHTRNFPFSLEITKSFLNNTIIYEFLPDYAVKEIWNLLTETRKRREQQTKCGSDIIKYINNFKKTLEKTNMNITNKIKDLENSF
jgi:hypothetical protein